MGKILKALATDYLYSRSSDYESNPERKKVRDLYCKLGKQLLEKLDDEGKKLLASYDDAQVEESVFYANDLFQKGFRLGVLIMMEAVTESDDLISQI